MSSSSNTEEKQEQRVVQRPSQRVDSDPIIDVESPYLDLSHHPHETMGSGYPLGMQLTDIDLTNCRLTKIENLEHLVNLKRLCLRQNLIPRLENISTLVHLENFDVYDNQLTKAHEDELSHLTNLKYVFLG
jgi:hypothetical protein